MDFNPGRQPISLNGKYNPKWLYPKHHPPDYEEARERARPRSDSHGVSQRILLWRTESPCGGQAAEIVGVGGLDIEDAIANHPGGFGVEGALP